MVELLKSTCGPYVILQTIGEGTFGMYTKTHFFSPIKYH